jgi:formylglycine-generating enzyme required for sulfatase activity/uncharacterized caspase-like protein
MIKTICMICVFSLLLNGVATATAIENNRAPRDEARRVAVVIGNADYDSQPLRTPVNDARAMTSLLSSMGFETISLENAGRADINQALDELSDRLGGSGIGLFFFAGHGIQANENKIILPVDARTDTAFSMRESGVDIDTIVRQMTTRRPNQPNIIIVDACLNTLTATAAPQRVLAGSGLPAQTLLAFATSPGKDAYDGSGNHGLFTSELIRAMSKPGLTVDDLFAQVTSAVSRLTASRQIPTILSTLDPQFVLAPAAPHRQASWSVDQPPAPVTGLVSMLTRGILPKDGEAQYELEFWESIKNSTEASDYEAYLEAYPNGRFAPLAKTRAERYKKASVTPEAPKQALIIEAMNVEYEVVSDANLRVDPSSTSAIVGELKKGSKIQITGRVQNSNWYQVKTPSGQTAYVFDKLVQEPAPKPTPAPKPAPPVAKPTPAPKPPPAVAKPPPAPKPAAAPVVAGTSKAGGEATRDCPDCPEMVVLPPGAFTMGDDRGHQSERPAHQVTIGYRFAIGKHEVTARQWNACVNAGGCRHKPEKTGPAENSPIRDVSWSDAQDYVRWLSKTTNQRYRLPTESEWEYAARAGTQSHFWWGDKMQPGKANCKDCGGSWDRDAPAEVDAFPANPFGLHGMNGGVWEWVADCWYKSHSGAPKDGSSREQPDCREHVIRGGSWRNDASYAHSASRFKYDTNVRYLLNGFRVAKTVK